MNGAPADSLSRCPHFGECGGCQSQDLPYAEQLAAKAAMLRTLFAAHWPGEIAVQPSPEIWRYRNKVDPAFAPMHYDAPPPKGFQRDTVLGFKRKGRWFWPLEISACHIGPPGLEDLLDAVRAWQRESNWHAFDSRTGAGQLKCLLVRIGKRTGHRMAALIARPGFEDAAGFREAVHAAWPGAAVHLGETERLADVSFAESVRHLAGPAHIDEELHLGPPDARRRLRFRISPMSFFQTNTLATEKLYEAVRSIIAGIGPGTLYDLYGGAGGIAFACADLAGHVHSVENVPEASEDGRANAALNGIGNVSFTTAKVEVWLKSVIASGGMPQDAAAVLDPPRAGLHPKALRRLLELGPRNLVYVSCNPKLLARELDEFSSIYRMRELRAFDLFPHTPHVEAVAWLERREA